MNKTLSFFTVLIIISVFPKGLTSGHSRGVKYTVAEYIATFKPVAISEMKRAAIPASITLAQAILESGFGNSALAVNANNHFGIKCKPDWAGKTYQQDYLCYKKYATVIESYEDHSNHIMTRKWYAGLFSLKITDYENWAVGLKKAGYAEAPDYAAHLIRIIKTYKLSSIDSAVVAEIPSLLK